MSADRRLQQTVKLAIDAETGELIEAEQLLKLPEEEFTRLRRSAMSARVARRRGGAEASFICACCKHPVYLSRHLRNEGNRWFVHDGSPPRDCVFYEGSRHTPEQIRALVYRGQQEGAEHLGMKNFLAKWLDSDPEVTEINVEQTTFSAVVKGEWRRPDVKFLYRGRQVVFEVQLSYTFLSDVIARDDFYKREGIFIVWVFQSSDRSRAVVTDEAFFNQRNLFVLDEGAKSRTMERNLLTFNGYHQEPRIDNDQVVDEWGSMFVGLRETQFPLDTLRPFYFDYGSARREVEAELQNQQILRAQLRWQTLVDRFLASAIGYYDSGYTPEAKEALRVVADEMRGDRHWHQGYGMLTDPHFMDYHGVLPVLLSIKLCRVVGYRVGTVYQVLEAGVRTSGKYLERPYTILYLWAYKKWRPPVKPDQHTWLVALAHRVKVSVDSGDETYRRFVGFDEAISLLFPDLEETLENPWGSHS